MSRIILCPLCQASSADYHFHIPTDSELNELRGFEALKVPKILESVRRRGICERHWEINLDGGKSQRSKRFPRKRPAISPLGPKLLPSTPKLRRSVTNRAVQDEEEQEPARLNLDDGHGPNLNENSNPSLRATLRRMENQAEADRREIQELRARLEQQTHALSETEAVLAATQRDLQDARSWSALSLAKRNQLPLLTGEFPPNSPGQSLEQLQEIYEACKGFWTKKNRPLGHPTDLDPFDTFVWMMWHLYRCLFLII